METAELEHIFFLFFVSNHIWFYNFFQFIQPTINVPWQNILSLELSFMYFERTGLILFILFIHIQ